MTNLIEAKRFQNFVAKHNMEVYFMVDNALCIKAINSEFEDDFASYVFSENQNGLFLSEQYIDGLEDMPRWIEDIEQLRNVVEYVSSFTQ